MNTDEVEDTEGKELNVLYVPNNTHGGYKIDQKGDYFRETETEDDDRLNERVTQGGVEDSTCKQDQMEKRCPIFNNGRKTVLRKTEV